MRYSYLRNGRTDYDEDSEKFINSISEDHREIQPIVEKNFNILEIYMNDNILPKAIDFESLLITAMEASINEKERSDLPDSAFGVRAKRQYPLNDVELVRNAIKYFKFCGKDDRNELAINIIKAIKKFKFKPVITPHNPIRKYIKESDIVIGDDSTIINKDKEVDKNKFNTDPAMEAESVLKSTYTKHIKRTSVKKITEYFVDGKSIYREPKGDELLKTARNYTKSTSGALGNSVESIKLYEEYFKTCRRFVDKFKFIDDEFIEKLTKDTYSKYADTIKEFKDDINALNRDRDAMIKSSSSGAIISINKESIGVYISSIQASNENISNILNILLENSNEKTLISKSMHFSEIFISAANSINDISKSISKNFR